uniref:Ig-like domain-containing protein n=1 Tax=Ursus maritimus TaxID=29073 RepID=A0A452U7G6_URSMA
MNASLLCCVAFCLLQAGHAGAGVAQFPRHRVTRKGQNVTLSCDPISGHVGLYWYRQTVGQGPEFLISFQNNNPVDKSGMTNNRFSAKRQTGTHSTLQIQHAEQGDSAVYLCASSLSTVGHSPLLPLHKPQTPLSLPQLEPLHWLLSVLHSPTERSRFGHQLSFG